MQKEYRPVAFLHAVSLPALADRPLVAAVSAPPPPPPLHSPAPAGGDRAITSLSIATKFSNSNVQTSN